MALICEAGQFAALNDTHGTAADPANQVVTLNNFTGVTPKVVFLWSGNHTTNGVATTAVLFFGAATSPTNQASIYASAIDASGASVVSRSKTDAACFRGVSTTEVETLKAVLDSFGSNQFTLTWNGTTAPVGGLINYFVLGGADLTNAKIVEFVTPTSPDSAFEVTGVGFLPDIVIFFSAGLANAGTQDSTSINMFFGAFDGANNVSWAGRNLDNSDPTVMQHGQRINICVQVISGDATYLLEAAGVSMDSDGFTLNVSTAGSAIRIFALCLKGGQYKVGAADQKTSTGVQAYTGVGFQPTGLMSFFWNAAALASIVQDFHIGVGATSGPSQNVCQIITDEDAQDTSDTDRACSNTKFIKILDHAQATTAEGDLDSFDSNGWTMDWTTADALARQFLYLAMGSEGEGGGGSALPLLMAHYEG